MIKILKSKKSRYSMNDCPLVKRDNKKYMATNYIVKHSPALKNQISHRIYVDLSDSSAQNYYCFVHDGEVFKIDNVDSIVANERECETLDVLSNNDDIISLNEFNTLDAAQSSNFFRYAFGLKDEVAQVLGNLHHEVKGISAYTVHTSEEIRDFYKEVINLFESNKQKEAEDIVFGIKSRKRLEREIREYLSKKESYNESDQEGFKYIDNYGITREATPWAYAERVGGYGGYVSSSLALGIYPVKANAIDEIQSKVAMGYIKSKLSVNESALDKLLKEHGIKQTPKGNYTLLNRFGKKIDEIRNGDENVVWKLLTLIRETAYKLEDFI